MNRTAVPDAAEVAGQDAWTALVMRSRLDPAVWVPVYGGDQTCYEHAGRFRAVKLHVEKAVAAGRAGRWATEAEHVWYARNGDTWWYVPKADMPAAGR